MPMIEVHKNVDRSHIEARSFSYRFAVYELIRVRLSMPAQMTPTFPFRGNGKLTQNIIACALEAQVKEKKKLINKVQDGTTGTALPHAEFRASCMLKQRVRTYNILIFVMYTHAAHATHVHTYSA